MQPQKKKPLKPEFVSGLKGFIYSDKKEENERLDETRGVKRELKKKNSDLSIFKRYLTKLLAGRRTPLKNPVSLPKVLTRYCPKDSIAEYDSEKLKGKYIDEWNSVNDKSVTTLDEIAPLVNSKKNKTKSLSVNNIRTPDFSPTYDSKC